MLLDLLKTLKECQHENVSAEADISYCPDCGTLVENKWYLVRCSCCNIKRVSYLRFGKIKPSSRYCPNCGAKEIYIEELDKINFIDVNFAVVKRVAVDGDNMFVKSQFWVDERENLTQKLLGATK